MNSRRVVLFVSSFVIALLMATYSLRPESKYLWILPLITSFCYLIPVYESRISVKNYITIIVDVVLFIRNCLTTLLSVDYPGYIVIRNQTYVNNAIVLLSLETFVVLMYVFFKTKKFKKEIRFSNCYIKNTVSSLELGRYYREVLLLLALFCVYCVFMQSDLLDSFTPIWASGSDSFDVESALLKEEKQATILSTAFYSLFGVFRILLVIFFVFLISKNKKKNFLVTILLLSVIVFPSIFTSEDFGNVLVNVVVTFLFVLTVYNSNYKSLTLYATIVGFFILSLALLMKGFGDSAEDEGFLQSISTYLQAYFPGVNSVAGVYNISGINKPISLLYDFYFTIPFRNTIFGLPGDFRTTVFFNQSNGIVSQIIPCVGHIFVYLSYFAPIVSALPIILSYRFVNFIKVNKVHAMDYVFMYAAVYCALTPFMYNYTILGSWLFMNIMFAYVTVKICNGFKKISLMSLKII